jgi:microcystin-dependent protein
MPFASTVVPRGWAPCYGQTLSIQQNAALFSLIGTTYGGNGVSTFALPDLRSRVILGVDSANQYPPGLTSGTTTVTLNVAQLPSHTHMIQVAITQGGRSIVTPTGHVFGTNTLPTSAPTKIFKAAGQSEAALAPGTNVVNDGQNQPHNNMQPYLVISYLIALTGVFPSRGVA